ncbi:regucalcin-like [Belonocnema kinseyi]|uniref:regucalcin-like n=1 Tax=Belonocnema kinseyi TaxID=2817044 RepID=UPI00143D33FF|nr:regucalcin-like [Belonocnema kinseyi]
MDAVVQAAIQRRQAAITAFLSIESIKQTDKEKRLGLLSFAVPVKGDTEIFVVGCGSNVVIIKWDSYTNIDFPPYYVLNSPHRPDDPLPLGNRLGYGSVDYAKRLYFATTYDHPDNHARNLGSVYSLDTNGILEKKMWNLGSVTGGFVWDLARRRNFFSLREHRSAKFYYADTLNNYILGYDFSTNNGDLDRREELFEFLHHQENSAPGRMAIDNRGWLWVPLLGRHRVIELNPFDETAHRVIHIPAVNVGGCTFGGPNWDILYVSTIGYKHNYERPPGDEGGHIFAIYGLQVKGVPTREYSLSSVVLGQASIELGEITSLLTRGERNSRIRRYRGRGSSHA